MSRSIHQTVASVFYKRSKAEVDDMTDPNATDPDVIELRRKSRIKRENAELRKDQKTSNSDFPND